MPLTDTLPGSLSLAFRRGDEFSTLLDFSIATTGYTWSAAIYSVVTGTTIATPTVTVVNAATGQVNLGLSEIQTAALAAGTYGWRLSWTAPGEALRTVLAGTVEVYN